MFYFLAFIIAFGLILLLTPLLKRLAFKWGLVDYPDSNRKIHHQPVSLFGGGAIFLAYFIALFIFNKDFLAGNLDWSQLLGFFAGALCLMIGGFLDDKYNLPPYQQIIFPLLAVLSVIIGGVEITKLTNPFGGVIFLQKMFFIGPVLVFFWLAGMMYTTKLLDGVDGLVTGLGAIGGLIIFLFTLTTRYYQPDIALASLILVAVCLGFLIFNFNPAKMFLGEGGSLLIGYILGVLAIISGGKMAITLLVMGIPILDVFWTIIRRLISGRNPFKSADKKHLHHRLLALGLNQKQTVFVFYGLALFFGLSGLFLQSLGKFWALVVLLFVMLSLVIALSFLSRRPFKQINS